MNIGNTTDQQKSTTWRGWLLRGGAILLLTILAIELMLALVDPLGIVAYYHTTKESTRRIIDHPERAYTLPEWTPVVADNDTDSNCTIAFIGDSFTQGMGVDPEDNFASRVARSLDANVINAGVFGYNLWQIQDVYESVEADGYVYLMLTNDIEDVLNVDRMRIDPFYVPAIVLYTVMPNDPEATDDTPFAVDPRREAFIETYRNLYDNGDVLTMIESDSPFLNAIEVDVELNPVVSTISAFDGHPDADGHARLASQMLPAVQDFTDRMCSDTDDGTGDTG